MFFGNFLKILLESNQFYSIIVKFDSKHLHSHALWSPDSEPLGIHHFGICSAVIIENNTVVLADTEQSIDTQRHRYFCVKVLILILYHIPIKYRYFSYQYRYWTKIISIGGTKLTLYSTFCFI